MKVKKGIAWLLSVFMIFSLFMGNSNVKAQDQVTENKYTVNFGTGSWKVNGTTVTAKLATTATSSNLAIATGKITISESESIVLDGFDGKTMKAYLTKPDGFKAYLNVTEGKTSLLNRDSNVGLNQGDTFTFVVANKDSGTLTPPQENVDYNNFQATNEKPILLEIIPINGKITLPNDISGDDKCYNGEKVKVRIATGTDLTISWDEGDTLEEIRVDGYTESATNNSYTVRYDTVTDNNVHVIEVKFKASQSGGGNENTGGDDNFATADKPVIIEAMVIGDGRVDFENINDEDIRRREPVIQARVAKNTESVTFVWNSNQKLNQIRVKGVGGNNDWVEINNLEGNSYELTLDQRMENGQPMDFYRIEFVFEQNFDQAIEDIINREYAYYAGSEGSIEIITSYFATELYNEFFNNGRPYFGMLADQNNLKQRIKLSGLKDKDAKVGLPYYEYTIVLVEPNDDGTGAIEAKGNIYVLSGNKDFVVRTGDTYQVVETSALSEKNNDVFVSGDGDVTVFGNGICAVGRLNTGDESLWSAHITQEHSGLGDDEIIGRIGCRLTVIPLDYLGVKITGKVSAAPWGFSEVPIFQAGASTHKIAEIYYGNDGSSEERYITISTVVDSRNVKLGKGLTVKNVAIDETIMPSTVATINYNGENDEFVIKFNTAYDEIPFVVTYSDGSKGYIMIHRVGLNIDQNDVRNNIFEVWHGTDNTERYELKDAEMSVSASFYYATGKEKPSDRVSLSVTTTYNNGNVERNIIDSAARLNTDVIKTTGEDQYCDDFLVWKGTKKELNSIKRIEVIAFVSGNEESFGGVKVGSGAGVIWEPRVEEPEGEE